MTQQRLLYLVPLCLLALFACFFGINHYPLMNDNEGLYAETAREMLVSHNYLIPHLNNVPYLEKPPLLYWLITLCFQSFGITAGATRLIPGLAALLTLASTYWLSVTMQLKTRWQTVLTLSSTLGILLLARIVFFDMLLTALISLSLAAFYHAYVTGSRWSVRGSYIALALSILTKGPIALVLVPLTILFFLLSMRSVKQSWRMLFDPLGIALFLAISLPWHLLATYYHTGFAWAYFINEYVLRFINKRVPHDYYHGPIYYYVIRVLALLLPWSLLLPTLCMGKLPRAQRNAAKFLWAWFLVPFIFFSLSSAKANYYMIVALPALTLLLNLHWQALPTSLYRKYLLLNYITLNMILFGAMVYFYYHPTPLFDSTSLLRVAAYVFTTYFLVSLFYLYYSDNAHAPLLLTGGMALLGMIVGITLLARYPAFYSEYSMAAYIKQHADRPVYLFEDFEEMSSLVFYLQTPLPIVDTKSRDLYYAAHFDAASKDSPQFIRLATLKPIAQHQAIYVAILNKTLAQSTALLAIAPFCSVFQDHTATLLSNTPEACIR
jgi:4-amino-4-deoxy-L-arabinose transferase-like glycosyltransferase